MTQDLWLHKLLQATVECHPIGIALVLRGGGRVWLAAHHLFLNYNAMLGRVFIIPPIQSQTVNIVQVQQFIAWNQTREAI